MDRSVDEFLMKVVDENHPRFGQIGQLTAHDWKGYRKYHVLFPDGKEEYFPDGAREPCPLEEVDKAELTEREIVELFGRVELRRLGLEAASESTQLEVIDLLGRQALLNIEEAKQRFRRLAWEAMSP